MYRRSSRAGNDDQFCFHAWFPSEVVLAAGLAEAQGSLSQDKYARGWGADPVRRGKSCDLVAIAWVLYDMFLRRRLVWKYQ